MGASLTARKPATLLRRSGSQGEVAQVSLQFDICRRALTLLNHPPHLVLIFYSIKSVPRIILTIN